LVAVRGERYRQRGYDDAAAAKLIATAKSNGNVNLR
jgi:hypothetical protein